MSRDELGEKWLRRLHRITGLDIHHASASGYGCEILDANDDPVFDDDGRPVLDRDRLVMFVAGWVDLPQDVWERSVAEDEARRLAALSAFMERRQ